MRRRDKQKKAKYALKNLQQSMLLWADLSFATINNSMLPHLPQCIGALEAMFCPLFCLINAECKLLRYLLL